MLVEPLSIAFSSLLGTRYTSDSREVTSFSAIAPSTRLDSRIWLAFSDIACLSATFILLLTSARLLLFFIARTFWLLSFATLFLLTSSATFILLFTSARS